MSEEYFLDITEFVCPMTFVRATLFLEKIPAGAEATIRLNAGEPLDNVPRAMREHGHTVVDLSPEGSGSEGVYLLRVRKAGQAGRS